MKNSAFEKFKNLINTKYQRDYAYDEIILAIEQPTQFILVEDLAHACDEGEEPYYEVSVYNKVTSGFSLEEEFDTLLEALAYIKENY